MDAHVKNVREASEANAADPAKAGLEKSGIAGTEPAEDKEAKVRRRKWFWRENSNYSTSLDFILRTRRRRRTARRTAPRRRTGRQWR